MSRFSWIAAALLVVTASPFLGADEIARLTVPRVPRNAVQRPEACAARGGPTAAPSLLLPSSPLGKAGMLAGSRAIAGPRGETPSTGAGPETPSATDQKLSGEQPDGCDRALASQSVFGPGAPWVFYRTKLNGVHAGDLIRWEWTGPDGSLRKATHLVADFHGRGCVWDGLTIAGGEGAALPGEWHVRVFVNSAEVASATFTAGADGAVAARGRLVRQSLASLFAGFARLGFAVTRGSCAGSDVLAGAVLDLMKDDLTALANSMTGVAAVIRFDVDRVAALRDKLPNMTGQQAADELLRLFEASIQAVRDARLGCDPGAGPLLLPPAVESLLTVATRLGIVSAYTLCFQCNEVPPPEAAAFISDQLNIASRELRAYAACLRGFDFNSITSVPLGAPFTALQSYVPLTALLNAIQQAILANDCACDSDAVGDPSGAGTIRGTVRDASNGQVIAGATVVVAGTSLSAVTAADGSYSLGGVPAGPQTLRALASGFIQAEVQVSVAGGQIVTQNVSLSPNLQSGEIRITLNWTKDSNGRPDDLDMHLGGPNSNGNSCFHIYYGSNGSLTTAPFAQLEVDNIRQAGHPPTETVRLTRLTPGIYRLFIHNYAGETPDGLSQSQATVHVFASTGQIFSQSVPSGSARYWSVLSINGQTGTIGLVNQLANSEPPLTPCR